MPSLAEFQFTLAADLLDGGERIGIGVAAIEIRSIDRIVQQLGLVFVLALHRCQPAFFL